MKTFKELNQEKTIEKEIRKQGLSLGINFSKEDVLRFNLQYGDRICLDQAIIIKAEETKTL